MFTLSQQITLKFVKLRVTLSFVQSLNHCGLFLFLNFPNCTVIKTDRLFNWQNISMQIQLEIINKTTSNISIVANVAALPVDLEMYILH